jgi:hypothetical protein
VKKLLVYIRTVLWSFIGIGTRKGGADDMAKGEPLGLLAVSTLK